MMAWLSDATEAPTAEALRLIAGNLKSIEQDLVTFGGLRVLWPADAQTLDDPSPELSVEGGPPVREALRSLIGVDVVALVSADEIRGVALLTSSGLEPPGTQSLFDLARAADEIAESSSSGSPLDRCQPAVPVDDPATNLDALVAYLSVAESSSPSALAPSAETLMTAEALALAAGTALDPVTGSVVHPAIGKIARQLEAGVDAGLVQVDYEVPILVTVPTEPTSASTIVAFFDAGSLSLIGWIDILPEGWSEKGAGPIFPTRKVYLEPPEAGMDLIVGIRDVTDPSWDCPLSPIDRVITIVPYSSVAGAERARIIVDDHRFVRATPGDFDRVAEGSFDASGSG